MNQNKEYGLYNKVDDYNKYIRKYIANSIPNKDRDIRIHYLDECYRLYKNMLYATYNKGNVRMKYLIELKVNISLLDIVNYVKNSIDVIVTFKVEDLIDDYKSNKNQNSASDYETLLQKEEAAIRQHISYEHQIKIEYEKVLEKIEVLELENKLLVYQIVS